MGHQGPKITEENGRTSIKPIDYYTIPKCPTNQDPAVFPGYLQCHSLPEHTTDFFDVLAKQNQPNTAARAIESLLPQHSFY